MLTAVGRSNRSRSVKVVVTGPFGAGKTSLISTISEIEVLSTEKDVSGTAESPVKSHTTVALDFGRLTVDEELALFLFGTPGQKRFDFMWEILAEGMLGFIVLVDAQRPESVAESREILSFFLTTADVPFVVAVNKVSGDPGTAVNQARAQLALPDEVRVVACDALERESVKGVLLALLYAVVEDMEAREPAAV